MYTLAFLSNDKNVFHARATEYFTTGPWLVFVPAVIAIQRSCYLQMLRKIALLKIQGDLYEILSEEVFFKECYSCDRAACNLTEERPLPYMYSYKFQHR